MDSEQIWSDLLLVSPIADSLPDNCYLLTVFLPSPPLTYCTHLFREEEAGGAPFQPRWQVVPVNH